MSKIIELLAHYLLISWFTPLRWCAIPLNSFISSGTNSPCPSGA
jgi:hypothetical protein